VLAAARRDADVVETLGEAFSARTMRAFHGPLRKHLTLDPVISEFSVDSPEGVALMRLAEALIRSPREASRYMPARLIRDGLGADALDFWSHRGPAKSALVNASALALSLARGVLRTTRRRGEHFDGNLPLHPESSLLGLGFAMRGSDAVLEAGVAGALGALARKFTAGADIASAIRSAKRLEARDPARSHSFDMLGEGARTHEDAERYLASYADAAEAIRAAGFRSPQMSVKLSSLSPRFDELSRDECVPDLARKLGSLLGPPEKRMELSPDGRELAENSEFAVFVDAEEQNRLELTLSVVSRVVREYAPLRIGVVVQAYGRRAMDCLEYLRDLAIRHPKTRISVRLVKGAYWDHEIKRAQVLGADAYPVWTEKRRTDVSYLACAAFLLDNAKSLPNPAFATHNARTVADVLAMLEGGAEEFLRLGCEFQRLHGMGESFDYCGLPTRVYSPVGAPDDLLAYLVRRLLENGANSSFLRRLAQGRGDLMNVDVLSESEREGDPPRDRRDDAHESARDSDARESARDSDAHDSSSGGVPASPRDLYGGARLGARGVDYEHPSFPASFAAQEAYGPAHEPLVCSGADSLVELTARLRAFRPDAEPSFGSRAAVLKTAADVVERRSVALSKMIMEEAGKTLVDAVNEVRELVDFFRFYAVQAETTLAECRRLRTVTGESCALRAQPRGPWLCVGPFNFPFAIVGGLAASAFVAGNPVVIKPHPSTPRCASALADILREAGAPEGSVHVVVDAEDPTSTDARGPSDARASSERRPPALDAGAALVSSGAFAGVSFVGSTRVAAEINLRLATHSAENGAPLARLVAETGGLNVLVADASALPEQVCDAALASFARSAGQRCSSARILVVDEGCKREVIRLIRGGLAALRVSKNVLDLSVDVGPLISARAAEKAKAHCDALEREGGARMIARAVGEDDGALFHPRVYDLNPRPGSDPVAGLESITDEVFAPVLHVVTYDGSRAQLERVIEAVNEKGYALTGGVMTRCESTKATVAAKLNCGNFYVNRDIVGAVVESQPFGGHGLSGNGVKAGSEGYLEQFVARKVICEDTTAAGGNVELMRAAT
jgi:RHH-type proline utilization regulon transcriptional repressor/proline dehydrogenase/delta 1-pyrroline-5-carboxylate dehydrogenase